ncbi:MAG: hypothetical protein AAGE80_04755 [Pseudomonadota bacterium]
MKFEAEQALQLLFDVNEPWLYILVLPAAILVTLGRQRSAALFVFFFAAVYVLYSIATGGIIIS